MDESYIFISRPFWTHFNISENKALQLIRSYLGTSRVFTDIEIGIEYLRNVLDQVQKDIETTILSNDYITSIGQIYSIFDRTFRQYMIEKKDREKIDSLHIRDEDIIDKYSLNRNAYWTLLLSTNVWIENYLLLHTVNGKKPSVKINDDINVDLFIMLYVYGVCSYSISLLTTSQKFKDTTKFPYQMIVYDKIIINEDICNPVELTQYHPVIYFDSLLCGNQEFGQEALENLKDANASDFGVGFKKEYGIEFIFFLRILNTFMIDDLKDGKYFLCSLGKQDFLDRINSFCKPGELDTELFYESFVLDKRTVATQLKSNDRLIWRTGVNRHRHEIRPFICTDDNQVFLCYSALEQAKQLWLSYYSNGGNIYSNVPTKSDALLQGIEVYTNKCTKKLVSMIREILRSHYSPTFDDIEVSYERIFGKKNEDYGDYDIVFYTETPEKELFLIEAKYFSDSLNPGAQMTDYEKLFRKGRYYDHCRKRCDLVISDPDAMKRFIKASGKIKVHFLFVSSKPLDIEFTDSDGVVSFPCLSIFDKYLEGKIESEDGRSIIRPFHII